MSNFFTLQPQGGIMQLDMHYYGTYVLAKLAGLKDEICEIIATSSQLVDDNVADQDLEFLEGSFIRAQASSHHVGSLANLNDSDQRRVWVPFHFLPGNKGNTYEEKLVCQKNSEIAQELVQRHLKYENTKLLAYLVGITAHVYADTFAHYGFSGVSSTENTADTSSLEYVNLEPDILKYVSDKTEKFYEKENNGLIMERLQSYFAQNISSSLGHGGVATNPDRPYLQWKYKYSKNEQQVSRDNLGDYLEACEYIYNMFVDLKKRISTVGENPISCNFSAYKSKIENVLKNQYKQEARINEWKTRARSGYFGGTPFEIPDYNSEKWSISEDKLKEGSPYDFDLANFYKSVSIHRYYVLNELLPKHGLFVY